MSAPAAPSALELAYLAVEVEDRAAFDGFLGDVVGLVPGEATERGEHTWRNDQRAQRVVVAEGPANDATAIGFEVADAAELAAAVDRLGAAGHAVEQGDAAVIASRRVDGLAHTMAPWGVLVEIAHGLADAAEPFHAPLVPGGFLTEGVGFGHVVFATTAFDESHQFATEGLGLAQTDWLEMELAPGIELEVRFYHCNPRHHTLALARAPFDLPQKLHHVMLEATTTEDVGMAFDRVWDAKLPIANGLGVHDNDEMFSFYVVTPAGFQLEFGTGARVVSEPWTENRRYDRISRWGHQPITHD
jgi:2,3-dihydroxybiphenyl 1,2-dioxygenase